MKKIIFRNHKKLYLSLAIIIAVVTGVVWYFFFRYDQYGIPVGLVSHQFVYSRPEGTLYYPNGKIFITTGRSMIDNDSVAWSGAVMTSNDSPEKIYQWYHDWLTTHGWKSDNHAFGGLASTQISQQVYSRSGNGFSSREVFNIAMDNPHFLSETLGKKVPTDVTIFEFSYIIR